MPKKKIYKPEEIENQEYPIKNVADELDGSSFDSGSGKLTGEMIIGKGTKGRIVVYDDNNVPIVLIGYHRSGF